MLLMICHSWFFFNVWGSSCDHNIKRQVLPCISKQHIEYTRENSKFRLYVLTCSRIALKSGRDWSQKLALRYKGDLTELANIEKDMVLEQGLSVGAIWALHR